MECHRSVLGPVLFIIFINDLECLIKSSVVRFVADDTKICNRIFTELDSEELQRDLNTVMEWLRKNNMKLHEHKFELMVHGASLNLLLEELPFTNDLWSYQVSGDRVLRPSNELSDLGVNVKGDLSWVLQIQLVTTKAQLMAAWVLSVFKSREENVMVPLYKSDS